MDSLFAKLLLFFSIICLILAAVLMSAYFVFQQVENTFGPPGDFISSQQRVLLTLNLFLDRSSLIEEHSISTDEAIFTIGYGESVVSVADRLSQIGYINDKQAFLHYMQYKGLDTTVQAGEYKIPKTFSDVQLANFLQDATPTDAIINVLAGWRIEEIGASLSTTGVAFEPLDFILLAQAPDNGDIPFNIETDSLEGFLFPGKYRIDRESTPEELIEIVTKEFETQVSGDIKQRIEANGLTLYEGVILASIIEREAVQDEEMPMIASVFFNRLAIGMKLESDPTIQYAIGQTSTNAWWKNPLSGDDLRFVSMYNTYQVEGLPPTPICNPSFAALEAVAYPAETNYYYFMARCDDSGWHNFSETYEQHVQNLCN